MFLSCINDHNAFEAISYSYTLVYDIVHMLHSK